MVIEKKYQVAISKNEKGEIAKCLDVEIVGADKYKAYKKEANLVLAKQVEELQEKLAKEKKREDELLSRIARQNLILAKVFFDDEVASGKCETNDPFENAFANFIYHHIALDLDNAPVEFKAILERLG